MSVDQDAAFYIVQSAITKHEKSQLIENQNSNIRSEMDKNQTILAEFKHAISQAEFQKNKLSDKSSQIRAKKSQLLQLQKAYFSKAIQNSRKTNNNSLFDQLQQIQQFIFTLSETAIDSQEDSVELPKIISANDEIQQILQSLVQNGDADVINFAQENSNYYQNRRELLLQVMAHNAI